MRHELFIQPEPFEFESESGALETGFGEFDAFESFESEAMVGGIPEKDYLRWIQFSLNMYFKKTGVRAPLVEDGKDSADFRNAVELFNARAWGRSKNKQIDTKFQDALIWVNEANSGYLKWLRTQLDKLGFAPFTVAYAAHEKPTTAIEEFQRKYSGKFGFSLEVDGFVGAKTHLALLHAIKGLKPPPPPPPKLPELYDLVLIAPVDDLAADEEEKERLLCLRDFFAAACRGKKVDDRYWKYPFVTSSGQVLPCSYVGRKNSQGISFKDKKMQSAMKVFENKVRASREPKIIAQAIKEIHDHVKCELNSLSYVIATALADSHNRWETEECVEARMLLRQGGRPESILKCFYKLLRRLFSATCSIPE